jgi:hypothetical protein
VLTITLLLKGLKMLDVIKLAESCGCELFNEDDDYCFARGDNQSCLQFITQLLQHGFQPEVNRGCQELTVVRF